MDFILFFTDALRFCSYLIFTLKNIRRVTKVSPRKSCGEERNNGDTHTHTHTGAVVLLNLQPLAGGKMPAHQSGNLHTDVLINVQANSSGMVLFRGLQVPTVVVAAPWTSRFGGFLTTLAKDPSTYIWNLFLCTEIWTSVLSVWMFASALQTDRNTPWTELQPTTGHTHRLLTHSHVRNLEPRLNKIWTCLERRRKPQ